MSSHRVFSTSPTRSQIKRHLACRFFAKVGEEEAEKDFVYFTWNLYAAASVETQLSCGKHHLPILGALVINHKRAKVMRMRLVCRRCTEENDPRPEDWLPPDFREFLFVLTPIKTKRDERILQKVWTDLSGKKLNGWSDLQLTSLRREAYSLRKTRISEDTTIYSPSGDEIKPRELPKLPITNEEFFAKYYIMTMIDIIDENAECAMHHKIANFGVLLNRKPRMEIEEFEKENAFEVHAFCEQCLFEKKLCSKYPFEFLRAVEHGFDEEKIPTPLYEYYKTLMPPPSPTRTICREPPIDF
ncbi:unnamed protein product [Caenorhabditis bovis]|uniref:Uncharacterized protein n=1 Tax=Caenorhabditis bovis TaxID=2654633 RepID=A0A8S1F6V9_9PELO|nr:unnamed protein product [Caenorhabditis bovis]